MPEIQPTFRCFDNALDLLWELVKAHGAGAVSHIRLAHGICTAPDGNRYAHAWLEDLDRHRVIFIGILDGQEQAFAASRAEYYQEQGVTEWTLYTLDEAAKHNLTSGHYGPWVPKYRLFLKETEP